MYKCVCVKRTVQLSNPDMHILHTCILIVIVHIKLDMHSSHQIQSWELNITINTVMSMQRKTISTATPFI